jgi:hypothetical protein
VFIKKVGKSQKKRGEKEGRSYFRSPQKYECHSHITPFDKKEWHSSFAPNIGSGAQEWRSKECRSLTHCLFHPTLSFILMKKFHHANTVHYIRED